VNRVGHIRDLDAIVTDSEVEASFHEICENEGVAVHIASN